MSTAETPLVPFGSPAPRGDVSLHLVDPDLDDSHFTSDPEHEAVDYDALAAAANRGGVKGLIVATLQAVGLAEKPEALQTAKQQLEELQHKPAPTPSDSLLMEHLRRHVSQESLMAQIELATTCYEDTFWDDFDKREGLNIDMLEVLFDTTEEHAGTPFLGALVHLRSQPPREATVDAFVDAERIARLMIISS